MILVVNTCDVLTTVLSVLCILPHLIIFGSGGCEDLMKSDDMKVLEVLKFMQI